MESAISEVDGLPA